MGYSISLATSINRLTNDSINMVRVMIFAFVEANFWMIFAKNRDNKRQQKGHRKMRWPLTKNYLGRRLGFIEIA